MVCVVGGERVGRDDIVPGRERSGETDTRDDK